MDPQTGGPLPFEEPIPHELVIPSNQTSLHDEDNTFAPPALSAYSIALLGDSMRVPQEDLSKTTVKTKLSVHFEDVSEKPLIQSSPGSKSYALPPEGSSSSGHANTSNMTSNSNVSEFSNLSHPNTSISMSNSNISNSNNPNSTPLQGSPRNGTSANSSDHLLDSKVAQLRSEPDLATSREDSFSSVNNGRTAPNGAPGGLMSTMSTARQVKRSRLSRRFRALGPPKRASDVEQHKEGEIRETEALLNAAPQSSERHYSPKQMNTIPNDSRTPEFPAVSHDRHDYKTIQQSNHGFRSVSDSVVYTDSPSKPAVSADSEFFKSLERLKKRSPNFPAQVQASSFPVPKRQFSFSPVSDAGSRVPLHEKPAQYLNVEKPADFRKPKHPQSPVSIPSDHKPNLVSATITPVPSAAVASRKRNFEPQPLGEDPNRRKIIYVNSTQYEKLELLGRGGSSKVYKVRSLTDKRVYAVKKVSFDQFDEACVKGFKGEIDLLNKLRDDNRVVSLLDHAVSEGSIYLVMECGDLDLAHVLSNKLASGKSLDMNFVRFHATEILRCVQAVHKAGIVHSDLKPANFLFVRGTLKIIDFGIANAVPDHTANIYRQSQIGTPNYMAPEALIEGGGGASMNKSSTYWKVGQPSDIWSCGCIIYQMIYGRPPYGAFSGQQRIMAIMNPMVEIKFSSKGIDGNKVPQSSIILMRKCLERNPNNRWTVEECLDCDFLKPKAVNKAFLKDLVYSAVNFGYNSKDSGNLTDEIYDKLVDTVLKQIEELNFA